MACRSASSIRRTVHSSASTRSASAPISAYCCAFRSHSAATISITFPVSTTPAPASAALVTSCAAGSLRGASRHAAAAGAAAGCSVTISHSASEPSGLPDAGSDSSAASVSPSALPRSTSVSAAAFTSISSLCSASSAISTTVGSVAASSVSSANSLRDGARLPATATAGGALEATGSARCCASAFCFGFASGPSIRIGIDLVGLRSATAGGALEATGSARCCASTFRLGFASGPSTRIGIDRVGLRSLRLRATGIGITSGSASHNETRKKPSPALGTEKRSSNTWVYGGVP
uniref:Uncharacterized protein n=1 Tax=Setaria italica TaxID=4555 RepID=K3XYL6_SETIT